MGGLRSFLGKLLGSEAPPPAAAQGPSTHANPGAGPVAALPAEEEESKPASEEMEFPPVDPQHVLSPITDVKYISGASQAGPEGTSTSGSDQLVLVYNGQDLVIDIPEEMKHLGTTDFISGLIDQIYTKYEVLFDTDDIFQVVVLLKKVRPAELP
jgi:hypothetical protein